jgi:hypothetical protein
VKKITIVLRIMAIAVITTATLITVNTQSQTKNIPQQYKLDPDIPIVDINSPAFRKGEDREIRKSRGEKYNTGQPLEDIFGAESDLLELPLSHAPIKPAFPVSQSDAILIGSITDVQAFLTPDKSYVYSEFTVHIKEVLKNFSSAPIAPDVDTTIERAGGIVKFTSGNKLQRGNSGEGLPVKQNRYLLFLKWSESGKDFLILTGYKLDGKVTPLDRLGKDTDINIFKNYRVYENIDETSFLKTVKTVIENPSQEVTPK